VAALCGVAVCLAGGCGPHLTFSCLGHLSSEIVCDEVWSEHDADYEDYLYCVKGLSGVSAPTPCADHGMGGCAYEGVSLTLTQVRVVRWYVSAASKDAVRARCSPPDHYLEP